MTDLRNLTNDEQIILLNTSCVELLPPMVSKLSGKDVEQVRQDVVNANAMAIGLMSDEEAKNYIEKHRRQHAYAREIYEQEGNE